MHCENTKKLSSHVLLGQISDLSDLSAFKNKKMGCREEKGLVCSNKRSRTQLSKSCS